MPIRRIVAFSVVAFFFTLVGMGVTQAQVFHDVGFKIGATISNFRLTDVTPTKRWRSSEIPRFP